jgi:hypothetical protein
MSEKCTHETSIVLKDTEGVSLLHCTWGCGRVLFQIGQGNGLVKTFTSDELSAELARLQAIEQAAREVDRILEVAGEGDEDDMYDSIKRANILIHAALVANQTKGE